ncbi:unnamed protein product [Kluyveromyces dobzhanskii CBS 2104]|uniref:WGS project CCBQ000000000 data, contig 00012 n=1 Tax=Kluyveromyces dobzhanskii CBS 2104 TaxID=1427455 RepID=A0A0A8L3G6_9SACH|nr:unnamed protein product [Kluyveromyces dobzhanskii CBS 2104]
MSADTNSSSALKEPVDAEIVEEKVDVVDESLRKNQINDFGNADKLLITKSLVIRKAEIMARQYSKWYLQATFLFSAFICSYGYSLDSSIRDVYTTYAANSYDTHSLLTTIAIVNMMISAVAQLFFAGLSDVFGRLSLMIVAVVFYFVGTIIQSQAYDVQRYCAGSVFYTVGLVGVMLQVTLFLSDNSSLKWRVLYNFVPAWPAIINMWVSGNIVEAANPLVNWSWNIAMWAGIFPVSCIPLILCVLHMRYLATKTEEWKELQNEKTFYQTHGLVQTVVELYWKLDIIGLLLLTASMGCILVPLTIAGGVNSQWKSGKIIGPLVLGVFLVPVTIYWESRWAKAPFAPYKLLKDRGIWAPLWMFFLVCFVYQMAAGYLYTILLVGMNQSDLAATRIMSLYSFVSAIYSPVFGFMVARTGRLKMYMIFGCCLYFVVLGLFYHYRGGVGSANGIIGAMVVWGIASCMYDYPVTTAAQSVTSHEHMATVTALLMTIFSIGGAVAAAISGAIWTNLLYPRLLNNLGDADLAVVAYDSPLDFIVDHEWGTPIRAAMVEAYEHVQRYEVLVGLIFVAPMLILTLCIRDPKLVDDYGQKLNEGECVQTESDDPIAEWFTSRFKKLRRRH